MNTFRLVRFCVVLLTFGLSSCGWYEEVKAAIEEERAAGEGGAAAPDELARERLGRASAERVDSGPRGPQNLRLWVGVWCDRAGADEGVTGDLAVSIDGVQLSRVPATCTDPRQPPMARPNGTAFALTVPTGTHSVTLETPDGPAATERFEIVDDKWLMIRHVVQPGGDAETSFSYSDDLIAADLGYDPHNAPGAHPSTADFSTGDDERDRRRERLRAEHAERARRLAELNAEAALPVRRGANDTPYRIDGRGGRSGASEPSGSSTAGERSRPSGSERGRATSSRSSAASDGDWNDAAMGSVNVRSLTTLNVWVNGRSIRRTTPVEAYPLPQGRHRVELRDDNENVVRTFAVDIEAGRARTLLN